MSKLLLLDVVGLAPDMVRSGAAPNLAALADDGTLHPLAPAVPAVTCAAQQTLLSGKPPARHGVVANGWLEADRDRVAFWEQSAALVEAPRLWDHLRAARPDAVSALLFFQQSIGADVDVLITPKPRHTRAGQTISWCHTAPWELYEELRAELGDFPLHRYWGPMAGIEGSQWIAAAARHTLEQFEPDLCCVYLPHLDYKLQTAGPESHSVRVALREVDALVGELRAAAERIGTSVAVVSEYAMTPVSDAVFPNRALRRAGLLATRPAPGGEDLDVARSRAFAVADHQVALVYAVDERARLEAREALEALDGVAVLLDGGGMRELGVLHDRSGDMMLLSRPDRWFAYPWWNDGEEPPTYAGTGDIHRKPGYDPLEMVFDPAIRSLARDPRCIRGSHGLAPREGGAWATLILPAASGQEDGKPFRATWVAPLLRELIEIGEPALHVEVGR